MTPHAASKDSSPDPGLSGRSSTWAKLYMDFSLQPWIPSGGCSQAPLQGLRDPPLPQASASLYVGLSQNLSFSTCPRAQDLLWHRFPSEIEEIGWFPPEHSWGEPFLSPSTMPPLPRSPTPTPPQCIFCATPYLASSGSSLSAQRPSLGGSRAAPRPIEGQALHVSGRADQPSESVTGTPGRTKARVTS